MAGIDLNCDLAEGFGKEAELMPLISSASLACGFHAGDPNLMHSAAAMAKSHGVRVGAHPSLPDRENFGRRETIRPRAAVFRECLYQIAGLKAVVATAGVELAFVKPHGALYNMACRDESFARPVVEAAETFGLPVMGLPGSALAAVAAGRVGFLAEGYADRRYNPDGTLVPRSRPDAVIEKPEEVLAQAERLARSGSVDSLCIHGDNPHAVEFARTLRSHLQRCGIMISAVRVR
jgi:UPF0271 protein